jgi:hypothetical protein
VLPLLLILAVAEVELEAMEHHLPDQIPVVMVALEL